MNYDLLLVEIAIKFNVTYEVLRMVVFKPTTVRYINSLFWAEIQNLDKRNIKILRRWSK